MSLLIVGLDGGTYDVIYPLMARGALPTLARLIDAACHTVAWSTVPPATFPAWTSFLTGLEPREHGVTDLFVHPPRSYALVPASGALRRHPTWLGALSRLGLRVASLGVPGTYPLEPGPELVIAGFDAPGASEPARAAVRPRALARELAALGGWRYALFNEQATPSRRHLAAARAALLADLAVKERIALTLLAREPWDVFFLHLQAADTAGHHFWHLCDPASPRHPAGGADNTIAADDTIAAVYARIDRLLARFLDAAGPEARLLIVSDHGMGGAAALAVHLNRFLCERGLLTFAGARRRRGSALVARAVRRAVACLSPAALGAATRLAPAALTARLLALSRAQSVDFACTEAFSDELDYAPSIWINRRGRFPAGDVDATRAERLTADLARDLLTLTDARGRPLVRAVHDRRALGRVTPGVEANVPDLVIEPAWLEGYRVSFLPSHGPGPAVRPLSPSEFGAPRGAGMPGVHHPAGLFIASGPGITAGEVPALTLAQAGTLVYALAGVTPPAHLEARLPAWAKELSQSLAPRASGAPADTGRADTGRADREPDAQADPDPRPDPYTEAERLVLTERLRALGYID